VARHAEDPGVHLGAYVSATDPSLDADNLVTAGKMWIDITEGEDAAVLRFRNGANTAWISLAAGGGGSANAVTLGGEPITMGGEEVTMGA
jgi:hypothetical protein